MTFDCYKVTYEITKAWVNRETYIKYLEQFETSEGLIYATEELKEDVLELAKNDPEALKELKQWFKDIKLDEDYRFC